MPLEEVELCLKASLKADWKSVKLLPVAEDRLDSGLVVPFAGWIVTVYLLTVSLGPGV
jgi:hypothetical protein